jgi:CRISPR system Cascade subunit CasA
MQNKVLKPALFSLLEGGPEKIDFGKTEVGAWVDQAAQRYSTSWGSDYFEWLWRTLDEPDDDRARLAWLKALQQKAQIVLKESLVRLPARQSRHYRGRVSAQGMFFGSLYKNFPELKEQKDATAAN